MDSFFDRLTARAISAESLLCVGLDPHVEFLSRPSAASARDFCLELIERCAGLACAFKPNSAFFEIYGGEGMEALRQVIAAVPKDVPVILDAKRGDIASSAAAYAQAAFEFLGADAITANPYLGRDALQPLLKDPARGVFLLCRTSNAGAADLQERIVAPAHEPLYLQLARQAPTWSPHPNLGLVVGATDVQALKAVRQAAPALWLLAPGVGAQGGELDSALAAGLRQDGLGLIIPVSRSLARAHDPGVEAGNLREAINLVRERREPLPEGPLSPALAALADDLLQTGCVRFGSFTLKSGEISPIYIDLRLLVSDPGLLSKVASAYLTRLSELRFDRLAAIPYAALPIATAISMLSGRPMIYPRKEVKSYGTRAAIEGGFAEGERVVVIDDLITSGGSKLEAIEPLKAAGLTVEDVLVLIDRQGEGRRTLEGQGLRLHSIFHLSELLDHWGATGAVSQEQIERVRAFMEGSG